MLDRDTVKRQLKKVPGFFLWRSIRIVLLYLTMTTTASVGVYSALQGKITTQKETLDSLRHGQIPIVSDAVRKRADSLGIGLGNEFGGGKKDLAMRVAEIERIMNDTTSPWNTNERRMRELSHQLHMLSDSVNVALARLDNQMANVLHGTPYAPVAGVAKKNGRKGRQGN